MLVPAPFQVPVKEDNEESRKTKGGIHSVGTPNTVSWEIKVPSSEDKREGEADILPPHGKKRATPIGREVKAPKRCKTLLSGGSGSEDDIAAQFPRKDGPLAES